MRDRSYCRGPNCRRPIIWTRTEAGRKLCLDAEPLPEPGPEDPRGVFFLDERDLAVAWPGRALMVDVGDLFRTHWATCPDREMFRR